MPNYDYQCTACGYMFEKFQRMSEAPIETCPTCGSKVKRLISGGMGVLFKGTGFYATDYKDNCCSTGNDSAPSCGSCCANGSCSID
ncbi:MAG: hypothetical protein Kow00107_10310 [Planctomycetota bacterium]